MVFKRNFSIAIVDVEKIDEINKVIVKYTNNVQKYSSHFYFNLDPVNFEDIAMDITLFKLEAENESDMDKKLDDLVGELDQLNTGYAIRDEDTHEMIAEIEHVIALIVKFDNVKFIKEGTYEKIDEMNHLKTEFGICKKYNPNFRPLENVSTDDIEVKPEIIYLFSDTAEDLSKLKVMIVERIMEIDSDFEVEFAPFMFID